MNNRLIISCILFMMLIASCQPKLYYKLPNCHAGVYKIYFGQNGYEPVLKDTNGHYIISLDSQSFYTSTSYSELDNTLPFYSCGERMEFFSSEDIEVKYGIKIVKNLVGETTNKGKVIPDYFIIIVEEKSIHHRKPSEGDL